MAEHLETSISPEIDRDILEELRAGLPSREEIDDMDGGQTMMLMDTVTAQLGDKGISDEEMVNRYLIELGLLAQG